MEIERNWNYGLNGSFSRLVELSIDIKFMNFGQIYKELCLLEVGRTESNFRNVFIRKMTHALHMHVKEGFRAWIVCLSNCDCTNNVLGETRGGERPPETS